MRTWARGKGGGCCYVSCFHDNAVQPHCKVCTGLRRYFVIFFFLHVASRFPLLKVDSLLLLLLISKISSCPDAFCCVITRNIHPYLFPHFCFLLYFSVSKIFTKTHFRKSQLYDGGEDQGPPPPPPRSVTSHQPARPSPWPLRLSCSQTQLLGLCPTQYSLYFS